MSFVRICGRTPSPLETAEGAVGVDPAIGDADGRVLEKPRIASPKIVLYN